MEQTLSKTAESRLRRLEQSIAAVRILDRTCPAFPEKSVRIQCLRATLNVPAFIFRLQSSVGALKNCYISRLLESGFQPNFSRRKLQVDITTIL